MLNTAIGSTNRSTFLYSFLTELCGFKAETPAIPSNTGAVAFTEPVDFVFDNGGAGTCTTTN